MLLAKKIFKFHAWVQKCHFGNFSILPKWHFWTRAWNLKIFWPKAFFWCIMKMAIRKSRIYAGKSTKRAFSLKSNDENFFQPIFQILHIKNAWFLLELVMALVITIGMRFLQVCLPTSTWKFVTLNLDKNIHFWPPTDLILST